MRTAYPIKISLGWLARVTGPDVNYLAEMRNYLAEMRKLPMKNLGWAVSKGVRIPPSAPRDAILLAGLFLFNCLQFSDYPQLAHVSTKPWLLLPWLYGLVGLVPLIWRDANPLTAFAVQWALPVAAWPFLRYYTPIVGIMVALHAVSVHRDGRLSLLALLGCFVPFGLAAGTVFYYHANFAMGLRAAISTGVTFVFAAGVVWGWGCLTRASQQHLQKVENERDEAKEAVSEQRQTLARELHRVSRRDCDGRTSRRRG
jgi:hypothetical protein